MSLSDLTSREAVERAIREYDELGQEDFLAKYGYGKALRFHLAFQGSLYDSKAIAGAAYGFQFPDRGPLKHSDFSGGEATVRWKLEELGFEVHVSGSGDASREEHRQ